MRPQLLPTSVLLECIFSSFSSGHFCHCPAVGVCGVDQLLSTTTMHHPHRRLLICSSLILQQHLCTPPDSRPARNSSRRIESVRRTNEGQGGNIWSSDRNQQLRPQLLFFFFFWCISSIVSLGGITALDRLCRWMWRVGCSSKSLRNE